MTDFLGQPCKPQFYDSAIVELAFLSMLQHVVVSGDSAQHLMDALAQGSHQDTVHVFSDFV